MDAAYRSIPDFTRGFDFEMRSTRGSDGRTLEGYVAMFDARSRIPDRNGDFDEILRPGFADRSLKERGHPIMQFDHGRDPRVGTVPIGVYEVFDRDNKGYAVRGRLFDNPVVEPVRQAIEGRAIKGMSFRFTVKGRKEGDRWHRRGQGLARSGDVEVREVLDADVLEAGPVVFPAYAQTSVSVRSLVHTWNDEDLRALFDELAALTGRAVDPTDLTGVPSQGAGRGDHGAQPREGDAPTPAQLARDRIMRALRPPLVLP
jgi:hypothetical protein